MLYFYEVYLADSHYHGDKPLTYSYDGELKVGSVVTVPLRNRTITGFVSASAKKPAFATKPIKNVLSPAPLPPHCLELARWLADYYACNFGDGLRQFAPTKPTIRQTIAEPEPLEEIYRPLELSLHSPLTKDQKQAITKIKKSPATTVLLHGDTGTGKTRVYLELAKDTLKSGRSAMILTPEIALTSQLSHVAKDHLKAPTYVLHSRLGVAERKKIWLSILNSSQPVVVIGPRSALFAPVKNPGLIVVDEAHEPAYKQEQSPRYHAVRAASQLGILTGAKVVLGTATPSITDYYLASQRDAVVRMTQLAASVKMPKIEPVLVDIKQRQNFSRDNYLSNQLVEEIGQTLAAKKQAMVYLNRRGTARVIMCGKCGWRLTCPKCDISLVYHGDSHLARCHTCGHQATPPNACPECKNTDIVYKSIGTKALADSLAKAFPQHRVARFDSDNSPGERVNELYHQILAGKIDILVGTQLLAKGFDLPKLGLVGVLAAESSLALPDFTAEERTFQLLYQVIGRVGRGHTKGLVIIQSYDPGSMVVSLAAKRDFKAFYEHVLAERRQFRFPPFAYLLKLTCRRSTSASAQKAAENLKNQLLSQGLPAEIIGPTPAFYSRRGQYFSWQLVAKSKTRKHLVQLAKNVPQDWIADLDPANLL